MFSTLVSIVVCWMCGEEHHGFKKCSKCKRLICLDCHSTVFIQGGNICFFCTKNNI